MLTVGQYLQPRAGNLPVLRYVAPEAFDALRAHALAMGFANAACGPLVRSSYRADLPARAAGLGDQRSSDQESTDQDSTDQAST